MFVWLTVASDLPEEIPEIVVLYSVFFKQYTCAGQAYPSVPMHQQSSKIKLVDSLYIRPSLISIILDTLPWGKYLNAPSKLFYVSPSSKFVK